MRLHPLLPLLLFIVLLALFATSLSKNVEWKLKKKRRSGTKAAYSKKSTYIKPKPKSFWEKNCTSVVDEVCIDTVIMDGSKMNGLYNGTCTIFEYNGPNTPTTCLHTCCGSFWCDWVAHRPDLRCMLLLADGRTASEVCAIYPETVSSCQGHILKRNKKNAVDAKSGGIFEVEMKQQVVSNQNDDDHVHYNNSNNNNNYYYNNNSRSSSSSIDIRDKCVDDTYKPIDLPIYWINVDSHFIKAHYMRRQLSRVASTHTKIKASNPHDIMRRLKMDSGDPNRLRACGEVVESYDSTVHQYEREKMNIFLASEIACTVSHIRAIQIAYFSGQSKVVIMEDDLSFQHAFTWRHPLSHYVSDENTPKGWEILQIVSVNPQQAYDPDSKYSQRHAHLEGYDNNSYRILPWDNSIWGTAGYVINRKGMFRILSETRSLYVHGTVGWLPCSPSPLADHLLYNLTPSYTFNWPVLSILHIENDDAIHDISSLEFQVQMAAFLRAEFSNDSHPLPWRKHLDSNTEKDCLY